MPYGYDQWHIGLRGSGLRLLLAVFYAGWLT
jgi:hypothetical protein